MNHDEQAFWAAVRSDLMMFVIQAFREVYPSKELLNNFHIDAIVHCLEESIAGRMPRLVINVPPRSLKSFLVTVALPAFILGNDPTAKVICISYSDDLAKPLARDFRRIIDSDWYRGIFPAVRWTGLTASEAVTESGGFRYATSVLGTLTGRGGDFIVIDDPIKPEEAHSDTARNSVNEWYRRTLLSRLDDKARSVLILVMQRLHVNDLSGFALAGGGFHHLSLPAIATRDEVIALRHDQHHRRLKGEALHEAHESRDTLLALREHLGTFNFVAQYQQSPATPDGEMFRRAWFRLVEAPPQPHPHGMRYVSIDSALSTAESADYTAICEVYVVESRIWILRAERGRWDYETLKAKVLAYLQRYDRGVHFVIERAGSGISLIKLLRDRFANCHSYGAKSSKVARAAFALPTFEAGRVHVVNEAGKNDWVEPLINEFVNFPHGRFDDQVDALTQLVPFVDARHNSPIRVTVV